MTMADLQCPYCEADEEVCHDDGRGYDEDRRHEMECGSCGKSFVFTTSIHFSYSPQKADCLNGEPHDLEHPKGAYTAKHYPEWVRCKNCDYENKGTYYPEGKKEA